MRNTETDGRRVMSSVTKVSKRDRERTEAPPSTEETLEPLGPRPRHHPHHNNTTIQQRTCAAVAQSDDDAKTHSRLMNCIRACAHRSSPGERLTLRRGFAEERAPRVVVGVDGPASSERGPWWWGERVCCCCRRQVGNWVSVTWLACE